MSAREPREEGQHPVWRTYADGVPPGRSLLWLGEEVIGMVIPGEPYWSTHYVMPGGPVGDRVLQRGTKAEDEEAARLIVESKLRTMGVLA